MGGGIVLHSSLCVSQVIDKSYSSGDQSLDASGTVKDLLAKTLETTSILQQKVDLMDSWLFSPREDLEAVKSKKEVARVAPMYQKLQNLNQEMGTMLKLKGKGLKALKDK